MKVCIDTFGCRLNRAESLDMEAQFVKRGWTLCDSHSDADMIVVRGCSVTSRAEHDSTALVDHIRRKYPNKRVVATGCMKSKLNEHWLKDLPAFSADAVPGKNARGYLKVQDGCAGGCTFCIVPQFRGKSESVDFSLLLDRAKAFAEKGYSELVVTGCNLSLYASGGKRLPDLVAALADVSPGGMRIRLGSLEPLDAANETLDAMASRANVCRFVHIPVQSGSAPVLSAMRRPYSVKTAEALVRKAASLMPMAGIGCDMMCGFPGETENDHRASMSFLSRNPFSNIHAFPFSARPGTKAADYSGQVPQEIRRERAHEMSDLVSDKRHAFAAGFKGCKVEVVIEDEEDQSGWTGEYFRCAIDASRKFKRRDKVCALVYDVEDGVLKARVK